MRYRYELFRLARLKKGWNKAELARRVGVTPPVIASVEAGENQSPPTIVKMATELGISMDDLICDETTA
jgi:transcriptional regulator with XRE-family HTH domain